MSEIGHHGAPEGMKHYARFLLWCLAMHSACAWIAHWARQNEFGALDSLAAVIDPLAVWFGIEFDLDGNQFFVAQLVIGGIQWMVIGWFIALFRNLKRRSEAPMFLAKIQQPIANGQ